MNLLRTIQNTRQQTHQLWLNVLCNAQEARINLTRVLNPFPLTKRRVFIILIGAMFGGVMLAGGGLAVAAHQEEDDRFCASCHTQPESTYFERSIAAATVDLATAHKHKNIRCIDCHSGEGLQGRVTAELMGASNALKWYTGTATQPAPLLYPVEDSHCVKCHVEVLTESHDTSIKTRLFGPKGHYHSYLTQWKETDSQAANCVSCHFGHALGGTTKTTWIVTNEINKQCDACHKALNRE